jgi:hypothetical protein
MFKLRLPTKLLSLDLSDKKLKEKNNQKKTRSGKVY